MNSITPTSALDGPELFNFATDVIAMHARRGNGTALRYVDSVGREHIWTFQQLDDESSRIATVLVHRGVRPGDRVLMLMQHCPSWWTIFLAGLKIGAILFPTPGIGFTKHEVAYCIRVSAPKMVIVDPDNVGKLPPDCPNVLVDQSQEFASAVGAAPAEYVPLPTRTTDPCLLKLTSGTTGVPKIVLHSHARFLYHGWGYSYAPGDVYWRPLVDTSSCTWAGPWREGASIFYLYGDKPWTPQTIMNTLAQYPITHLEAIPGAYALLLACGASERSFRALRDCLTIASRLDPALRRRWVTKTGLPLRQGYNQSELGAQPFLISNELPPDKEGSLGKPLLDIAIIDDDGSPLPPGRPGEIAIRANPRPLPLFLGYWMDPEATAARFKGDWYLTRDVGIVDEDGYFWLAGRTDDLINSFGVSVAPEEVEGALATHPAVYEAAAIGQSNDLAGQVVKAFVVLSPGFQPSDQLVTELQEHVKQLRGTSRYPREVEFLSELPKARNGKLQRQKLRDLEQSRGLQHY